MAGCVVCSIAPLAPRGANAPPNAKHTQTQQNNTTPQHIQTHKMEQAEGKDATAVAEEGMAAMSEAFVANGAKVYVPVPAADEQAA